MRINIDGPKKNEAKIEIIRFKLGLIIHSFCLCFGVSIDLSRLNIEHHILPSLARIRYKILNTA